MNTDDERLIRFICVHLRPVALFLLGVLGASRRLGDALNADETGYRRAVNRVTEAGGSLARHSPCGGGVGGGLGAGGSGSSNVLWAVRSSSANTAASSSRIDAPPRRSIAISAGKCACGLTSVSVSTLFFAEADPEIPASSRASPLTGKRIRSASIVSRTLWAAWCSRYISRT